MVFSRFWLAALSLACCVPSFSPAQPYVLTTIAGRGAQGYADGPRAGARFALPEAITRDTANNIYIGDSNNAVIRKIDSAGIVSTVAGQPGDFDAIDGGPGVSRVNYVIGLVAAPDGTVYFTDLGANTVRRLSSTGMVTTVAGSPWESGAADGTGSVARFNAPRGLGIDSAGNLYVADHLNATIRKVTPAGVVTTFAGSPGQRGSVDGVGAAARFRGPYGIAVDRNNNVFVADWDDATIRKITPAGEVTTYAGQSGNADVVDGIGTAARFDTPSSITVDVNGTLFITERFAHVIRLVYTSGQVNTIAGTPWIAGWADGSLAASRFNHPGAIVADQANSVIIADTYNGVIRRVSPADGVTTWAGLPGAGHADGARNAARFLNPGGLSLDASGNVFIADTDNHVIRKMTPSGEVTTVAGAPGTFGSVDGTTTTARFSLPTGVVNDAAGNVYVSDFGNDVIRKITPNGLVGVLAGKLRTPGSDDGQGGNARFDGPIAICFTPDGALLVADYYNHTLRKVALDGVVTTFAGQAGTAGDINGTLAQARFNGPVAMAYDRAGNLYVCESRGNVVRKVTPDGNVSTLAGSPGLRGDEDGVGAEARFDSPGSIAVTPDDKIFVIDVGNHKLRQITAAGAVTSVIGSGFTGYSDGMGESTGLLYPTAVASDSAGNLYLTDGYNSTVRKASPARIDNPTSQLVNLSVRAQFGANERLIAGFVVAGPEKPILVRAIGPGLIPYIGGAQTASDPRLEMYDGTLSLVQSNEDWGGTAELRDAFSRVGAFALSDTSLDAAAVRAITGLQSVHVITPGAGIGLVEAYDAGSSMGSRLINVSARYQVTAGGGALVAGFAIAGTHHKTLLIRGVGPTLVQHGLPGALPNPRIELYNQAQQKIAENDDWGFGLKSTFSAVYAFDFVDGSKDAALLISLPPGIYTAQLSGVGTGTGEALVEVYEVGN